VAMCTGPMDPIFTNVCVRIVRAVKKESDAGFQEELRNNMSILVRENGGKSRRIDRARFEAEDNLQKFIFESPESLPLYEIKEDIRLLILAREFPTESGPIDAIGVDRDGEIYVIETKLYKNPDKRLVVAQVLDYGASLWMHADKASFLDAAQTSVRGAFRVDLSSKIQEFFSIGPAETADLLEKVKTNLNNGVFKFVVLMDKLHNRLKDLVVFLNANTRFDVYAVEIEQYKFEKYQIIIPKLFGSEVKKEIGASTGKSGRRTWDERQFFDDASARVDHGTLKAIQILYAYAQKCADDITWGVSTNAGSFNPKFGKTGASSPFSVYSNGTLQLNFQYIDDGPEGKAFRKQWVSDLTEHLKFPLKPDQAWKNIEGSVWAKCVEEFITYFDALLKTRF
jgi:hypothetical protein